MASVGTSIVPSGPCPPPEDTPGTSPAVRTGHSLNSRLCRFPGPIGNWKWGDHALTDLDFTLPRTAVDLQKLTFIPSDEGLELDIPADEGGAEDAADGPW
jgi:hypothetical protein